jgi:hypothetical protein
LVFRHPVGCLVFRHPVGCLAWLLVGLLVLWR